MSWFHLCLQLYKISLLYMYHVLFMYPSVDEQLSSSTSWLTIVNRVPINTFVQVFLWFVVPSSFEYTPRNASTGVLFLVIWGTSILISIATATVYILVSGEKSSSSPTSSPATVVIHFWWSPFRGGWDGLSSGILLVGSYLIKWFFSIIGPNPEMFWHREST